LIQVGALKVAVILIKDFLVVLVVLAIVHPVLGLLQSGQSVLAIVLLWVVVRLLIQTMV
jgi:hypothetical protein